MTLLPVCHINLARIAYLRGAERQTELLIRELAKTLPQQRLVVLEHGVLAKRLDDVTNLEVCRVRSRLSALRACHGGFLSHAHEPHASQVAYMAQALWGNPYIITRRTDHPIGGSRFTRRVYCNARTVVVLSTAIEAQVRERFERVSITRIPSAWAPKEPRASVRKKIRERYATKFLVGHIASMDDERKGHRVLLEAASKLEDKAPDIHFLLLGAGYLEAKFREQADGLANVSFQGWQEDPFSWISAFDLFAFPSLYEGLGSILLDVLHAGVPVVASCAGGIPDVITSDSGILVEPNNADALAREILSLYYSSADRDRLSQGARARSSKFSPQAMTGHYMNLYQTLGVL